MSYYDIEKLKNVTINVVETEQVTMSLYEYLRQQYSVNESYFLYNILNNDVGNLGNDFFCTVLMMFYVRYDDDKLDWLHHTMDIIVSFNDEPTNLWIEYELRTFKNNNKGMKGNSHQKYLDLKNMVHDPEVLLIIKERLKKEKIIRNGEWYGITPSKSVKLNRESALASLMFVMKKKGLFKKDYQAKQYHMAFAKYFKLDSKGQTFKPSLRYMSKALDSYFYFI